jgi:HUS1 checkpoint protein
MVDDNLTIENCSSFGCCHFSVFRLTVDRRLFFHCQSKVLYSSFVIAYSVITMRFRAKLAAEHVALLSSIMSPMARLAAGAGSESSLLKNGFVLYLDDEYMRWSIKGKTQDTNGIVCFSEIKAAGGIFLEHRIESNADKNVIVMELDLLQFRTALQSVQADKHGESNLILQPYTYVILKLSKRGNIPCLCLESTGVVKVHHAIPIRIVRAQEWPNHLPPAVSLPSVQVVLGHSQASLRTLMDRLRNISPTVHVHARLSGDLTVQVDTEGASLRTYFSDLIARADNCAPNTSGLGHVVVDTKKLYACLQWQQYTQLFSSGLLCLVENEALVIHVVLNPEVGFFTYYLPVHYLSKGLEIGDV